MRTLTTAMADAYASGSTTMCRCLKVVRRDTVVQAYCTTDQPVEVDGVVYEAAPGLDLSAVSSSSGFAVDNLQLTLLPNEAELPLAEIIAGLWDFARFTVFEVDYTSPTGGTRYLRRGTTGEVQALRDSFSIEFRSLKQALQQSIGIVTQKTCRARLGDELCRVDLTPFTFSLTVTSVTSRQVFAATGATQADDYFTQGPVKFTAGDNAGFAEKVRGFAAGVFTMAKAMPFDVQVGDVFTAIAGCQKRRDEDCVTKFANPLNFQGEPDLVGVDVLTADPVAQ